MKILAMVNFREVFLVPPVLDGSVTSFKIFHAVIPFDANAFFMVVEQKIAWLPDINEL